MNYLNGDPDILHTQGNEWSYLENDQGLFVLMVLKKDVPWPVFSQKPDDTGAESSPDLSELYANIQSPFRYIENFRLRNHRWAILFSCDRKMSKGQFRDYFYPIAAKTRECFQKLNGASYSAAVSFSRQQIHHITSLYQKALHALEHAVFDGAGGITFTMNTRGREHGDCEKRADCALMNKDILHS